MQRLFKNQLNAIMVRIVSIQLLLLLLLLLVLILSMQSHS
jgi:hypothetical protein